MAKKIATAKGTEKSRERGGKKSASSAEGSSAKSAVAGITPYEEDLYEKEEAKERTVQLTDNWLLVTDKEAHAMIFAEASKHPTSVNIFA